MKEIYWRGVAATLAWLGLPVAAIGLVAPAGQRLTFTLLGLGLTFFTWQAYYLVNNGHIKANISLHDEQYLMMGKVWLLLMSVATILLLYNAFTSESSGIALWLLALSPIGGTIIMLVTNRRLAGYQKSVGSQ